MAKLSKKLIEGEWSLDESLFVAQMHSNEAINVVVFNRQGETISSSLVLEQGFIELQKCLIRAQCFPSQEELIMEKERLENELKTQK